jgi:hypothetical protein
VGQVSCYPEIFILFLQDLKATKVTLIISSGTKELLLSSLKNFPESHKFLMNNTALNISEPGVGSIHDDI